ncbi:MAG TPA: helix-turn-helix domain-containing protein, partial [Panacibacter sp.]|nr:helix-turn-helix domain-containing protein [Panacibacter sp.]
SYRNRFEELLQTIDTITFSNIDQRLLFYLNRQMSELGSNLRLTHQEIADDLNSSREVISRSLKRMEAKNLLLLHRNSIELLQPLNMAAL